MTRPKWLPKFSGKDTAKMGAEFLEECRGRNLEPRTLEKYRWALAHLADHCRDLPREGRDLLPVLSLPQHGRESRKTMRRCLVTFFGWCERRHRWPNPLREIDPPSSYKKRLPRVLSELEVAQLFEACRTEREKALVMLVLQTGLRLGEVAGLRWADIGPDYLTVRDGKSGDRVVSLRPDVKRKMLPLGDGAHVWVGPKGPLTRSGVNQVYRRLFRRSGLEGPKLGPHVLRHTFATQYVAGGGDVAQLRQILGHASISTTQIYVTLSRSQVAADHAAHSPVATWRLMEKYG